jgi:diaminopimelate epimerase
MVSIDMGVPQFAPAVLPFTAPVEALRYSLKVAGSDVEFGAVSVGNPHIVLEVGNIETAPVAQLGPVLERHAAFPQRVNVGFMQVLDETHIRLRVFERGVGETRACGTGACAAVAVGRRHGRLGARVAVALPGGVIDIVWEGPGQPLSMTGPAAVAYRGQVELDPYLTWR